MTGTPTTNHFAALDALRGIAACLVVWFHSAFVNGTRPWFVEPANLYVDLFFVLSGFVIAHAYLPRIDAGLPARRFIWSRLARIYPLHGVMLAVFLLYAATQTLLVSLGLGDGPSPKDTAFTFLINACLLQSVGILDSLSWNYPSWSISAEFWTYVLFFFFATTCFRHRRLWAVLLSTVGFGTLLTLALSADRATLLSSHDFGLLRCCAGFFAGLAVYDVFRCRPHRPSGFAAHLTEISAVCLSIVLLVIAKGSPLLELAAILSFCPLIYVLAAQKGFISRLLISAPLQFIGRISYSIYMSHALVLSLCGYALRSSFDLPLIIGERRVVETLWATPINLGLIALVIALASLSYRWIERPAQRALNSWYALREQQPVAQRC